MKWPWYLLIVWNGIQILVTVILEIIYFFVIRPYFKNQLEVEILVQTMKEGNDIHFCMKNGEHLSALKEKMTGATKKRMFFIGNQPLDDNQTILENGIHKHVPVYFLPIKFFPTYWSTAKDSYRRINITQEAKYIKRLLYNLWDPLQAGLGNDAYKIDKIYKYIKITNVERVENPSLFRDYILKRNCLKKKKEKIKRIKDLSEILNSGVKTTLIQAIPELKNSPLEMDIFHDINEHVLFHGTVAENVDSICKNGLKIERASDTGLFGKGIYCAEDPTKSDHYADRSGNIDGRTILLCRVGLGEMYVSKKAATDLRKPPCRTKGCYESNCKQHRHTFDSAVGKIPDYRYREFIVYKDHRVYTEYIITYSRTDDPREMKSYLTDDRKEQFDIE